jgi:uncharacterized protein
VTGLHPTRQPMPYDAAAPAELGLRGVYDAPQPTDQERHVNTHHQIVDRYMDGFRRSDHEAILDCLTEDVVWHIHGLRTTEGKAEFDDEIENPAFEGGPELTVERTFDAGDVVVVAARVSATTARPDASGSPYTDLFTFRNGLIAQVDSYVVPLP